MSPPFASVTVVSFKPVLGLLLAVTAGYGYLSMTVGREACRPVVDCSIDSSVCSAPKVRMTPPPPPRLLSCCGISLC